MEVVLLKKAKKDRDYWKQTGNEKIMKRITACRSGDGSVIYLPPTQGDKRGSRTKKRKPRGLPFLYF